MLCSVQIRWVFLNFEIKYSLVAIRLGIPKMDSSSARGFIWLVNNAGVLALLPLTACDNGHEPGQLADAIQQ